MSFLRRLLGKFERPPWASFMAESEFAAFKVEVETATAQLNLPIQFDFADGSFTDTSSDLVGGLLNLAQLCHGYPQEEWPDLIQNHLKLVGSSASRSPVPEDFETAKSMLKVRLFPLDMLVGESCFIEYPICDSFFTWLVLDLPDMVSTVRPESVEAWGVDRDTLLQIALDNVWSQDDFERREMEMGNGVALYGLFSEGFFAASHALLLDRYFQERPAHGVLVSVPVRNILLYHPVETKRAQDALGHMLLLAAQLYADGPGSITPNVLWWRDGKLETLPARTKGKKFQADDAHDFFKMLPMLPD